MDVGGSRISDKEHTTAALWHSSSEAACSHILSVKDSVGPPKPALPHEPEDGSKRPSFIVRQDAGDILPYDPGGANSFSQSEELKREVAARIVQSEALSCDREGLAGGSANKKVNWSDMVGLDLCEVAKERGEVLARLPAMVGVDRHSAAAMLKDGARELVDLADAGAFPAQGLPCYRGGLYSTAHRQISERHHAAPRKDSAPRFAVNLFAQNGE